MDKALTPEQKQKLRDAILARDAKAIKLIIQPRGVKSYQFYTAAEVLQDEKGTFYTDPNGIYYDYKGDEIPYSEIEKLLVNDDENDIWNRDFVWLSLRFPDEMESLLKEIKQKYQNGELKPFN